MSSQDGRVAPNNEGPVRHVESPGRYLSVYRDLFLGSLQLSGDSAARQILRGVRHRASGIVASALEVLVFSPQLTRNAVQLCYPGRCVTAVR